MALRRGMEGVAEPRRIRAVWERCWSGWFGSRHGGEAAPRASRGGGNGARRSLRGNAAGVYAGEEGQGRLFIAREEDRRERGLRGWARQSCGQESTAAALSH